MRGFAAAERAAVIGGTARDLCENCETRVFTAAQDDAEIVETGLAGGKTENSVSGIEHFTDGAGGESELKTIRGADENTF